MENEKLNLGASGEPEQMPPQVAAPTEISPVEEPELPEAATPMDMVPTDAPLAVLPPSPKKHPRGLVALVTAALLVVCASAAVLVFQSPQRIILGAITKGFSQTQQQEKLYQKFPMLAKRNQLAQHSSESELELRVNTLEVPGMSPMVGMLCSQAALKGSWVADPDSHTQTHQYQLLFMGKKLGTAELYASPSVLAVGVPEYYANRYLLDFDRLPTEGPSSMLFSGFEPADLQNLATGYKAIMGTPARLTAAHTAATSRELGELLLQHLANAEFNTVKEGEKKYYTATLTAADTKALAEAFIRYLYLKSPLAAQLSSSAPTIDLHHQAEQQVEELNRRLPDAPTVLTLEIIKGDIRWLRLKAEGPAADRSTTLLEVTATAEESHAAQMAMLLRFGEGDHKRDMKITASSSYDETSMSLTLLAKMKRTNEAAMELGLDFSLEGATSSNNLRFKTQLSAGAPVEGEEIKMELEGRGDFYVKDDAVVLHLPDVNATATINQDTLSCNLGLTQSTVPHTGTLTAPTGVDMLTMNEKDFASLVQESRTATYTLVKMLLSWLRP